MRQGDKTPNILTLSSKLGGKPITHNVTFFKKDHWLTDTGLVLWVNQRSVYLAGGYNTFNAQQGVWQFKREAHKYRKAPPLLGYLVDIIPAELPAYEVAV